jgi:hypothetical protein
VGRVRANEAASQNQLQRPGRRKPPAVSTLGLDWFFSSLSYNAVSSGPFVLKSVPSKNVALPCLTSPVVSHTLCLTHTVTN